MINKRLIKTVEGSMRYVIKTVLYQWICLLMNIIFITSVAYVLQSLYIKKMTINQGIYIGIVWLLVLLVRFFCQRKVTLMGYLASHDVKQILRQKIYSKILSLGIAYQQQMSTSEVVQVAMEGIEQLEIYFSKYLPQFIYSLLAPITLFILFCFLNIKTALLLLVCVPLIPVSIIVIQKLAKRLLAKYWGAYTTLGDSFLENLQGLTTLKVYQGDEYKTKQMDQEAEKFRKVTMKVLTMQLNSISVMDIVAFGGAALAIALAVNEYSMGNVTFVGMVMIILLSSEFFIPLRLLGSFFHIAMNGMAASDKIFQILDTKVNIKGTKTIDAKEIKIEVKDLSFGYDEELVLENINFTTHSSSISCFVGVSGCGKSTLASILCGYQREYQGSLCFNGVELSDLSQENIMEIVTIVNHDGYIFAGDINYNLKMADKYCTEEKMWEVLRTVQLDTFIKGKGGLTMEVLASGSNLSGGQKQRLLLARALLKDTPVYIFDEATSNIDIESENAIMQVIYQLQKTKTVFLITHRLDNGVEADCLYMMAEKKIIERGRHRTLMNLCGKYATLYQQQKKLLSIYHQEVATNE